MYYKLVWDDKNEILSWKWCLYEPPRMILEESSQSFSKYRDCLNDLIINRFKGQQLPPRGDIDSHAGCRYDLGNGVKEFEFLWKQKENNSNEECAIKALRIIAINELITITQNGEEIINEDYGNPNHSSIKPDPLKLEIDIGATGRWESVNNGYGFIRFKQATT